MKHLISFHFVILLLLVKGQIFSQNTTLFEEHFDNNSKGWPVGESQWSVAEIKNGKYYMECKAYLLPNSGTAWATAPNFTLPDNNFKIQCNTKWLKNRIDPGYFHSYALQVGNYRFELFGNGDRRLMFWDGKQDNVIIDYAGGNPSLFTRGAGIINVTIEIKDGIAKMFGNDQLMFEKKIASTNGELQLRTTHSEVVEFDDLIVTKLQPSVSHVDPVVANLHEEATLRPLNIRIATDANFCQMLDSVHSVVISSNFRFLIGPLYREIKADDSKDYWSMIQVFPDAKGVTYLVYSGGVFHIDKFESITYNELIGGSSEKISMLYNKYLDILKACYGSKRKFTSYKDGDVQWTTIDGSEGQEKFITIEADLKSPVSSHLAIYIDWGE